MPIATRLNSDMGGWMPVARHYAVDGGWLVVVVCNFWTATGTDVFYTDELAGAQSMESIVRFPEGTTHDQALINLGYEVVDTIGDAVPLAVEPEPEPEPPPAPPPVQEILPPEIGEMVANANPEGTVT